MAIPIATQPKPARKPAVAPHTAVVFGSFRNIARLTAMTRLITNVMAKVLGPAAGGVEPKALAFIHALPNRTGEYQRPPTRKAENAAARIAQRLRVCIDIRTLTSTSRLGRLRIAGGEPPAVVCCHRQGSRRPCPTRVRFSTRFG